MRKTKSTAGLGLSTGSNNEGDFNDQFAWESPAVGKGMRRQLSSNAVMMSTTSEKTEEGQPPLPQANNFTRGFQNGSTSNLQNTSKARGLGKGGSASNLIFKKGKKSLLSFNDEEEKGSDENGLEPKVFIPYETAPGHTPRKVAIRRLKAEYLSQSISTILENAGIVKAMYGNNSNNKSNNYHRGGSTKDEGTKQQQQQQTLSSAMIGLPLSVFDDATYEMYDIEKWVQYQSPARAVFVPKNARDGNNSVEINNQTQWKPCRVVSVVQPDAENKLPTSSLQVKYDDESDDAPVANLDRLQICFDAEDPSLFAQRVVKAYRSRRLAEAVIKYNLYVDCMPSEELGQLDAEQISRVLARAMSTKEMQRNDFDTSTLLNEINVDFARTMNKIIFDANLSTQSNREMYNQLSMNEIVKDTPPVPQKGVVDVATYDLEQRFKVFVFHSFLVQPEVCYVLERNQSQCNQMLGFRLINTTNKRTLTKEEYMSLQKRVLTTAKKQICDDWPSGIISAIKNGLAGVGKGHFDISMNKEDMYRFSKLRKLLHRINLTMEDTLRILTRQSLENYKDRIMVAGKGRVEFGENIMGTRYCLLDKGANLTEEARARVGMMPPVFRVTVEVTKEKVCINQQAVDESQKAMDAWNAGHADDGKDGPDCDVEIVEPIIEFAFTYDDLPQSCADCIVGIFDNIFEPISDIEQIERTLMDKLFWSTRPIMKSVKQEEAWVKQLRQEIVDTSNDSIESMNTFLSLFDGYREFLNVDAETAITSIVGTSDDISGKKKRKVGMVMMTMNSLNLMYVNYN
jgi:dynein heavy chain